MNDNENIENETTLTRRQLRERRLQELKNIESSVDSVNVDNNSVEAVEAETKAVDNNFDGFPEPVSARSAFTQTSESVIPLAQNANKVQEKVEVEQFINYQSVDSPHTAENIASTSVSVKAVTAETITQDQSVENISDQNMEQDAHPNDHEIKEVHSFLTQNHKNHEHKKHFERIPVIIFSILTIVALVIGGFWIFSNVVPSIQSAFQEQKIDYSGTGEEEIRITILSGETAATIAKKLANSDIVMTSEAFIEEVSLRSPEPVFSTGTFKLKTKMSAKNAVDALIDPKNKLDNMAVIPEGSTAKEIYAILSSTTNIPVEDFEAAASNYQQYSLPPNVSGLEGWLFPATYEFTKEMSPQDIIQTMIDRTKLSLENAGIDLQDAQDILIKASIIQSEARSEKDFYKVSRVIDNRLAKGMKLQMDSTSKYGAPDSSDKVWSTDQQLADPNPWNTYFVNGLPLTPISNPGDLAIEAALKPAEGNWLYFVTTNQDNGETKFASTIEEHEAYIEEAKKWCEANPDSQAC